MLNLRSPAIVAFCVAAWLSSGVSAQTREKPHGEKYALLVGVRQYEPNELRKLAYSEADVVELSKVLRNSGYTADNIVLLTQTGGAQNNRFLPLAANIRRELKLLVQDRSKEDTVLVAFAGHGVQLRGGDEFYFCPSDASLEDPATLVSLTDVYKELEKCKAGFRLLLVDACRNDPLAKSTRARSVVDLPSVTRPQEKEPPGGVAAFFSCSKGEEAFEHDSLRHGVFFHFVIEGLRGAALGANEEDLTLPDLEKYVKKRVRDFVGAKYGQRQFPEMVNRSRDLPVLVSIKPIPLGELRCFAPATGDCVRGLAFLPGEQRVLASTRGASRDEKPNNALVVPSLSLWEIETGRELAHFAVPAPVV